MRHENNIGDEEGNDVSEVGPAAHLQRPVRIGEKASSLERTVDEVYIPSVHTIGRGHTYGRKKDGVRTDQAMHAPQTARKRRPSGERKSGST